MTPAGGTARRPASSSSTIVLAVAEAPPAPPRHLQVLHQSQRDACCMDPGETLVAPVPLSGCGKGHDTAEDSGRHVDGNDQNFTHKTHTASKHVTRSPTSLTIREEQIKTTPRGLPWWSSV